jgi:catechol 2,3-dioxygenase-like lactoylglutathione lyase family enzyme
MKLDKIGLIMLGTKDLERSLAFYRDRLGLTVQTEIPGFAFLDGGGVRLALSEEIARVSEHTAGATEVVFLVEGVRAAFEGLQGQGVEFTREPRAVAGPMWAANFNDPDGHRLSIFGAE